MGQEPYKKRKKNNGKKYSKGKRLRRIILVIVEAIMVCILGVGCYGVSIINSLQRGSIDKDQIYVASIADNSNNTDSKTEIKTEANTAAVDNSGTNVNIIELTDNEEYMTLPEETGDDILSDQNLVNGFWNILIVGVDARDQSTLTHGVNSDVIMICSINANTKEVKLVSIYRDTLLKMYAQDKYNKANAELAKSGIADMISMINMNLDLQITDCVIVNWLAVVNVVDAIGGIDLEITDEEVQKGIITGYVTEIVEHTGIGTNQIEHGGLQHCNGVWTVAYCRNRYTTNNDYGRTARQREVISKILAQAKVAGLGNIISALRCALPNIYTTLDNFELYSLAQDINSYTIGDTSGFPFDYKAVKYYENVGDVIMPENLAANVSKLHQFLFGNDGYQPSSVVQNISNEIAANGY